MKIEERNQKIIAMRNEGYTLDKVSKAYGVSIERVRQIVLGAERKKERMNYEKYGEFIKLNERIRNCLYRKNITDLENLKRILINCPEGIKVRNIGNKSIGDIEQIVGFELDRNRQGILRRKA